MPSFLQRQPTTMGGYFQFMITYFPCVAGKLKITALNLLNCVLIHTLLYVPSF